MATRWGIFSAGKISGDFTASLKNQDPDEHKVVAIAARSKERAQDFANKYGIETAYGSYEELVKNPDIDIVYIGSIHPEHHKLSMLCLNAGKNVLCEKPVTMTLAAAKEVFSLAKEKKLFYMEGFWSLCFPIYKQLRHELEDGTVGEIKMVNVKFFVDLTHIDSLSTTLDFGCYTVMFADFVFREKPEKITVHGQLSESGVDTGAVVTLTYSGGRLATLVYSSLCTGDDNNATILGTKGYINVHNFFCPTKMTSPLGTFEFPLPKCSLSMNLGEQSNGFKYEQDCVRECLKKGLTECPLVPADSSLNIMNINETVLQQLGVKFSFPHTV